MGITFSFWGFFSLLFILLPNLLVVLFPPRTVKDIKDEHIIITILERIGLIACMFFLTFKVGRFGFGFSNTTVFLIWLLFFILSLFLYYSLWIRYVIKGRDYNLLFSKVIIPIPMAFLPLFALLLTGIMSFNPYLIISVVVFAIGHLINSWHSYNEGVKDDDKKI